MIVANFKPTESWQVNEVVDAWLYGPVGIMPYLNYPTNKSYIINRMKYLICILFTLSVANLVAQKKETFDLVTYTVPAGWKETSSANVVSFTVTNNQKGTYCQIAVYASTASKGNTQADFESEWQELVVKTYKPSSKPELLPKSSENGWEVQGGVAPFEFNGASSAAMLVTASNQIRCISVVILTNTQDYQTEIEKFLESVDLKKTETISQPANSANNREETKKQSTNSTAINSAFTFTTTNFDNGWTSTVQEDWVHVLKGDVQVLIHYPTSKIDLSSMDYKTISNNAWNTLVAPRYSNLNNFVLLSGTSDYEKPHFIAADVTDNATGKKVYVALFKKGNSGWIEFITSDKNSFVRAFGLDISKVDYYNTESSAWDPLRKMADYNKFAVGVADLEGKWTNNFAGMTQYVNIYTGADAGASSHSSTESFQFSGNTYHWELSSASGMVGNLKFQGAKSDGRQSLPNNWQIHFSDLEGKPKTYNAFFSCIKGARILWLEDSSYASGYTGYGKKN